MKDGSCNCRKSNHGMHKTMMEIVFGAIERMREERQKMKNEIVVQAIVGMHANNFNNNKIKLELFHLFSSKYTRNDDDRFRVCSATKPVYEENQN